MSDTLPRDEVLRLAQEAGFDPAVILDGQYAPYADEWIEKMARFARAAIAAMEQREPDKWRPTPEEQADGNRGIRWVWNGVIHGRPTSHDLREYLLRRGDSAMCSCQDCQTFYTSPPTSADAVDAERLDWLQSVARCEPKMDGNHVWWPLSWNQCQKIKGPNIRAAIDAAIAATKEKA